MMEDSILFNWLPFDVYPSSLFCEIPLGSLFSSVGGVYRLLHRDAVKVTVVKWNWFTKLFWGGKLKNEHRG